MQQRERQRDLHCACILRDGVIKLICDYMKYSSPSFGVNLEGTQYIYLLYRSGALTNHYFVLLITLTILRLVKKRVKNCHENAKVPILEAVTIE